MYCTVAAVAVVRKQKNEQDTRVTVFVAPINEYKNFCRVVKEPNVPLFCVVENQAVKKLQYQGRHECMCGVLCV